MHQEDIGLRLGLVGFLESGANVGFECRWGLERLRMMSEIFSNINIL